MAQSLEVNNKTYLPSVVLAKEFNYTSDYISKLARDEKVLGTRVGRQWFVEPESLRTFVLQLEVEKKIVKENLSLQRKRERLEKSYKTKEFTPTFQSATIIGGKSVAVVLCGFILGCLMLFGHMNGLRLGDLASGTKLIGHALQEKVGVGFSSIVTTSDMPAISTAHPITNQSAAVMTIAPPLEEETHEAIVYTVFPDTVYATTSIEAVIDDPSAAVTSPAAKNLPFSDEIMLETYEGTLGVRPVFKDSEGQLYELSVNAVTTGE